MPETAAYRVHTEQIIRDRANIISTVMFIILVSIALEHSLIQDHLIFQTASVQDVEQKIGCGQIEELIIQAENELTLSRKMLGWKPWEKLVEPAPAHQWDWPPAQFRLIDKTS